jgi:hypothetical protein
MRTARGTDGQWLAWTNLRLAASAGTCLVRPSPLVSHRARIHRLGYYEFDSPTLAALSRSVGHFT